MSEEWRSVVGWENEYEVSSLGRVRSLSRTVMRRNGQPYAIAGRLRKISPGSHGYPVISATRIGVKTKPLCVHRLVAEAFLPRGPTDRDVRHKDGIKTHSALSNLEWGTRSDNAMDRVRHGTSNRGARSGAAKLTEADVHEIRWLRASGMTQADIGTRFSVHQVHVGRICAGNRWEWLT